MSGGTTAILIATPTPVAEATRQGTALLAMLIILGVILIVCATAVVLLHARRRNMRNRAERPPVETEDPWTESAKRMVEVKPGEG